MSGLNLNPGLWGGLGGLQESVFGLWGSSNGLSRSFAGASLALNFLTGTIDPRITFSRTNAVATRVNASGALELVGANTPRFDYSPTSVGTLMGLLIEAQSTNILLNSLLNGTNLGTQSVTVSAQSYTLSFYGTGSIALSGTYTGTLVGTGLYPTKSTLTFTPTAGTLTLTVTGTVQYAQLEAGVSATSFIPTAGTSVTRSADLASLTGTNFSSWFNPSAGTFVLSADSVAPTAGSARGFTTWNGTAAEQVSIGVDVTRVRTGSVDIGSFYTNVLFTGKRAVSYSSGSQAAANSGAAVSSANAGLPTGLNALLLGAPNATTASLNGHLKSLTYYPQRLSNAQLQALTA